MTEYSNITEAVNSLVAEWSVTYFEWGKYDCAQMVAALCARAGFENPLEGFDEYISPQQARKTLRARGFKKYVDALNARFEPIENANFLMNGDLVGIKSDERGFDAIGIRTGGATPFVFAYFPQWDLGGNPITSEPSKPSSVPLAVLEEKKLLTGRFWKIS